MNNLKKFLVNTANLMIENAEIVAIGVVAILVIGIVVEANLQNRNTALVGIYSTDPTTGLPVFEGNVRMPLDQVKEQLQRQSESQ